jgi:hypothetical protein
MIRMIRTVKLLRVGMFQITNIVCGVSQTTNMGYVSITKLLVLFFFVKGWLAAGCCQPTFTNYKTICHKKLHVNFKVSETTLSYHFFSISTVVERNFKEIEDPVVKEVETEILLSWR